MLSVRRRLYARFVRVLVVGATVWCVASAGAQEPSARDTTFHPVRFGIVAGITTGSFLVGHVFLNHIWWKGSEVPFHFNFQQDWGMALGADKFGHAYFPMFVSGVYSEALMWCGVDSVPSLLYASGLALLYQTYIEIRDGFSEQYGFSFGDFGADVLGAAYPVAQHYWPALRSFNWKISYYPSDKYRAGDYHAIIDDYESTYHWLSINVHDLLPEEWRAHYPALINLAIGHSVKNIFLDPSQGHHELFIALDWNLEALPGDGWLWTHIKHILNYYHLPSPAVRVYPDVAWWGLKF